MGPAGIRGRSAREPPLAFVPWRRLPKPKRAPFAWPTRDPVPGVEAKDRSFAIIEQDPVRGIGFSTWPGISMPRGHRPRPGCPSPCPEGLARGLAAHLHAPGAWSDACRAETGWDEALPAAHTPVIAAPCSMVANCRPIQHARC
jgi:hypothetical protein